MYSPFLYQLPQHSFGSWLKKNAGAVGTVTGLGIGAALAPFTGGLSLAAGASLGATLGGSVGGAVQQNYQEDKQAALEHEQMLTNQRNTLVSNEQNKLLNGTQATMFRGTNNFAYGGGIESKMPTSVGTPKYPVKNLSIPYSRVPKLMEAKIFGSSANPLNNYFEAVERNLTPTTQDFIYNRTKAGSPEEAAIQETISGQPHEFYSTNNTGVTRLIPTVPIDSSKALKAKEFLTDMYNRGQIKYANGGKLTDGSNKLSEESKNEIKNEYMKNFNSLDDFLWSKYVKNDKIDNFTKDWLVDTEMKIMDEIPHNFSGESDIWSDKNLNEEIYLNDLYSRLKPHINTNTINQFSTENTPVNIYKKLKSLQNIPMYKNDVDSLQKYLPNVTNEYNLQMIKPFLKTRYAFGGLLEYGGSTHEASPYGGVPVDSMGNPASITGDQPSGLVEVNEVSWQDPDTGETYIFSNRIKA